jgi:hypothetical protein
VEYCKKRPRKAGGQIMKLNSIKIVIALIFMICITHNTFSQKAKNSQKTKIQKKTVKKGRTKKDTGKKKDSALAIYRMAKLSASITTKNGLHSRIQAIGITDTDLEYAEKNKKKYIPIKTIKSAFFETGYYAYDIQVLEYQKKYSEAAEKIVNQISPAIKYINIPNNNIVDPLVDAAFLYIKAAETFSDKNSPEYNKSKAYKTYLKAYKVFKMITKAKWFEGLRSTKINIIYCILRMEKYDLVEKKMKEVKDIPEPEDSDYGTYWLIDAAIKFHKGMKEEALDSAVKSAVFDCKNIYTFPKALLLSAFCYEDILNNYRARDIYFETARLFFETPEGKIAFKSIQFIREKKLTEEPEAAGLEKVFFNSIEDVNKKVDEYIAVAKKRQHIDQMKRKTKETTNKNK